MLEAAAPFFALDATGAAGDPAADLADPLAEGGRWDAEVETLPGAGFFHRSSWARVLRSAYGFNPAYFTVREGGRLRGVLPMAEVDSPLTGRRGVSLPFSDECPPLAADPAVFGRLCRQTIAHARRRRWKYVEIHGGRDRFECAPASVAYLGHTLDLRPGEAALLGAMGSGARGAIRKAEKSGLEIEISGDMAAVRAFYELMRKTRKRHGLPPQPLSFFAAIQREVLARGEGCVILARHGGQPVAGAIHFRSGKNALYKYGASDEAFNLLRANNRVMWEAIRLHLRDGMETLDFGRTSPDNEGLRRFKLSWGCAERRIEYVRFDCRAGRFVPGADSSRGWHTRLFRLLPDRLLVLIGEVLYRHAA